MSKRSPRPSKDALRQRAVRAAAKLDRERLLAVVAGTRSAGRAEPVARLPVQRAPVHETVPQDGPGADEFVLLPAGAGEVPPVDGAGPAATDHPAPVLLASTPEPEPAPPPPKPPTTAEEVSSIALGLTMFFTTGVMSMFAKNPGLHAGIAQLFSGLAPPGKSSDPLEYLPTVTAFVHGATTRVCMKYAIKIPYQDELIVCAAIGVGAFGHFGTLPGAVAKSGAPETADGPGLRSVQP